MCQLGAVIFSKQRVWRKDGVRSHEYLMAEFKKLYPGEKIYCAEYDFEYREWGMANGNTINIPKWAKPMLAEFELENWGDAEKLMNFVMHAGIPEDCLFAPKAMGDYEAKRKPLYKDYEAKRNALYEDYKAKCNALWCVIFADPKNRITIWRGDDK